MSGLGNMKVLVPQRSILVRRFASLSRAECILDWVERFKRQPPKYTSVQLMRKILAYEEQVAIHGGHSKTVRRVLKQALKDGAGKRLDGIGKNNSPIAPLLREGTHLVREWNGRTYRVEVVEDGFRLDDKHYRSLSSVAQRITGAHWSGPRFFGLVSRKEAEKS